MGVAIPGIAPLNPGMSRPAETPPVAPARGRRFRAPRPRRPRPTRSPEAPRKVPAAGKNRRIPLVAALVMVAAAALFTAAAVVLLLYRARGAIQTNVTLGTDGREELVLTCAGCDDGAIARFESASAKFANHRATLRLGRELAVGDNKLPVVLERRPGKTETVELVVPVEFRVRGDTSSLDEDAAGDHDRRESGQGQLRRHRRQGRSTHGGRHGDARARRSRVRSRVPTLQAKTLEHRVSYAVTPPGASPKRGEVLVRIGVTPLVLQAPGESIVIDSATFVLAGRTAKNGVVSVEGRPITVDTSGQFAQVMGVSAEGETTVVVRAVAPDQAPRLIPIRVRRVASLLAEAERVRRQATTSYAAIAAPTDAQRGVPVLFDGSVLEARVENFATFFLMETKNGCTSPPCRLRVTWGSKSTFVEGDAGDRVRDARRRGGGPAFRHAHPVDRRELRRQEAPVTERLPALPVCTRCGERNEARARYCSACGASLWPTLPPTERQPVARPATIPPLREVHRADPLLGLIVADRYRVIELIGRGGMGVVYKAEHSRIGKILALKLLTGELTRHSEQVGRFKREALMASRLSHPNTVQVFDFGDADGLAYLAMEYVRGENLGAIVDRLGPLGADRTAKIVIQICSSLAEAHEKGIVHRDLKPENIMVVKSSDGEDVAKVLDFGLAKLRESSDLSDVTLSGAIVGTPYYMAPEQIRGEAVGPATDVYALGALMYSCLTGTVVFDAQTPMGVLTRHLVEEPEPPSARAPGAGVSKSVRPYRALRARQGSRTAFRKRPRAAAGSRRGARGFVEPERCGRSARPRAARHPGGRRRRSRDARRGRTLRAQAPASRTRGLDAARRRRHRRARRLRATLRRAHRSARIPGQRDRAEQRRERGGRRTLSARREGPRRSAPGSSAE